MSEHERSEARVMPGDPGCWRIIGVTGDTSCPELRNVVHCRNCPVYTSAGRTLFERPSPPEYVTEWTTFLAQAKVRVQARTLAVLVFRLGDEWLGLDAGDVVEIAEMRPRHRIPHRAGPVLGGLVNVRGQLLLFVSLEGLLRIEAGRGGDGRDRRAGSSETGAGPRASRDPRLIVIQRGDASWTFRADEVRGVHRFAPGELAPVPVTVAHGAASLSRGLLPLGELRIGYLDGATLFESLRKAIG